MSLICQLTSEDIKQHFTSPTWQDVEVGRAEAVAVAVGAQTDVHARVLRLGVVDDQLVEVGAVRAAPHLARRAQHDELLVLHVDRPVQGLAGVPRPLPALATAKGRREVERTRVTRGLNPFAATTSLESDQ